jgi:hypothetical protein
MTRIIGTRVYRATCCGREYGTAAYASINFSAFEYWTDGATLNSLAPEPSRIYRCQCSGLFLMGQTQTVGLIRRQAERPHAAKDTVFAAWMRNVFGTNTPDERPAPEKVQATISRAVAPAPADLLPLDDFPSVIGSCTDDDILIVARRRWWQHLNEPYRGLYRASRHDGQGPFPPFNTSPEQTENMQALLALMQKHEAAPSIEQAELHRELGRLESAKAVLDAVGDPDSAVARAIAESLSAGLAGPVRYRA